MDSVVIVHDLSSLETLRNNTRELIIPDSACNESPLTSLQLTNLTNLERISIGNNSLTNVVDVVIANITTLREVTIGQNSFSSGIQSLSINHARTRRQSFRIEDCPSLSILHIEEKAFSGFLSFILKST